MNNECSMCTICLSTCVKCSPKGTSNPTMYFVGEAMGPDENKCGVPFVGRAGKFLHETLNIFGVNENNARFFNVIRCYPDNGTGGFRAPDSDEISNCIGNLYSDINSTNPKVIITLGATASKALIGEEFSRITKDRGKVFVADIDGVQYNIVPTYHPSYILRNKNPNIEAEFRQDIKTAIKVGMSSTGVLEYSKKRNTSKTIEIYNYEDFDMFCKKYIDNSDIIGYDIETNALDTHSMYYKVVGFSLASSSDIGCYVVMNSLDFNMSEKDRSLVEKRLSDILTSKRVILYNCMHELPATLNWLNIDISSNVDDILVMVKLMMGTADDYEGNGGLKAQCVMHLNSEDWSKDLDTYASIMYKFATSKQDSDGDFKKLMLKYYDESDIPSLLDRAKEEARTLTDSPEFSYELVPSKLISRYGSIDSSILFDLIEFYRNWMKKESENLGIDLFTGYKYWMWHHISGYILERNGAYWNDEKATKVENWCISGEEEALRNIVRSRLSKKYIESKAYGKYTQYLFSEYLDSIISKDDYTIVRKYVRSVGVIPNNQPARDRLSSMSIVSDKKGVYKLQVENLAYMYKDAFLPKGDIYNKWVKTYLDDVYKLEDIEDLKRIINPGSTGSEFRDYVSDILIIPKIRYARLYDNIVKFIEEPDFSLEGFIEENDYDSDGCIMVSLVYKLNISSMSISERFRMFLEFILDGNKNFKSWKVKRMVKESINYRFESMDADTLNTIYELYLMCGIDVENKATWTPEFEWMFNYKMYKKFNKLVSTYINGKVGRKNVYLVDRESYSRGDKLTRREGKYKKGIDIPSDKMYMLQTSFKVNIADTGRWTAGIHNLPASDAIKGIYTSRFKGGCIAMPDGSQMEVRTLAAESGDEALLQAFKDGVDIHRFFASKIYNVPYEEVQKWQRGLAKNAVFGILYGESEKAFADIYLGGDIGRAHEIFEGMFNGFPRIKNYVDRKHNQYQTTNKVTTLTQRFIDLSKSRDDPNRILRQSQNYPIQASAEDIAGVILYKLCEWLDENNMKSKPFCFIHDSIEIDMHPDELFIIISKLDYLFNKFPMEEFNVPVACDIPISTNMGTEIEVKDMDYNDDYTDISITMCGFIDDIEDVLDTWRSVYKVVEEDESYVPDEEDKDVYMPISERFLPKKAPISMKQGTYRKRVERRFHIITK